MKLEIWSKEHENEISKIFEEMEKCDFYNDRDEETTVINENTCMTSHSEDLIKSNFNSFNAKIGADRSLCFFSCHRRLKSKLGNMEVEAVADDCYKILTTSGIFEKLKMEEIDVLSLEDFLMNNFDFVMIYY